MGTSLSLGELGGNNTPILYDIELKEEYKVPRGKIRIRVNSSFDLGKIILNYLRDTNDPVFLSPSV